MPDKKKFIYSFAPNELKHQIDLKQPFKYRQLFSWLYTKRAGDFDSMTDLSAAERAELQSKFQFDSLKILKKTDSKRTATKKYLLGTDDGYKIESVLIPDKDDKRYTLCLSSQIGCSLSCDFCATGTMKLTRNLETAEMIDQYRLLDREVSGRIKNLVFMGMGEPLHNRELVEKTIDILCHEDGFAISSGRISVSTAGILEGIRELMSWRHRVHLMVSLHSAVQKKRDILMPGLKGQPLTEMRDALKTYCSETGNGITLEYVMIKDFNDGKEDIRALKEFCRGLGVKINLLALNKIDGRPYLCSLARDIEIFIKELENSGITAVQRFKKGDDIAAACGQLVIKDE